MNVNALLSWFRVFNIVKGPMEKVDLSFLHDNSMIVLFILFKPLDNVTWYNLPQNCFRSLSIAAREWNCDRPSAQFWPEPKPISFFPWILHVHHLSEVLWLTGYTDLIFLHFGASKSVHGRFRTRQIVLVRLFQALKLYNVRSRLACTSACPTKQYLHLHLFYGIASQKSNQERD